MHLPVHVANCHRLIVTTVTFVYAYAFQVCDILSCSTAEHTPCLQLCFCIEKSSLTLRFPVETNLINWIFFIKLSGLSVYLVRCQQLLVYFYYPGVAIVDPVRTRAVNATFRWLVLFWVSESDQPGVANFDNFLWPVQDQVQQLVAHDAQGSHTDFILENRLKLFVCCLQGKMWFVLFLEQQSCQHLMRQNAWKDMTGMRRQMLWAICAMPACRPHSRAALFTRYDGLMIQRKHVWVLRSACWQLPLNSNMLTTSKNTKCWDLLKLSSLLVHSIWASCCKASPCSQAGKSYQDVDQWGECVALIAATAIAGWQGQCMTLTAVTAVASYGCKGCLDMSTSLVTNIEMFAGLLPNTCFM